MLKITYAPEGSMGGWDLDIIVADSTQIIDQMQSLYIQKLS